MLDAILRWRRLAAHLEKTGVRAPATVVDIAKWGSDHESSSGEIDLEDELIRKMPGETLAPSNTGAWYVRKTRLEIRPADEPEAVRTAEALGKAKIGFTVGGGGAKPGGGKPPSEEQLAASQNQMDQAQAMLEQAQQFMSGGRKPDDDPEKESGSGRDG